MKTVHLSLQTFSEGLAQLVARLHAPKAFGEEVTGSNPLFSTTSTTCLSGGFFMYCCYIIYSVKLDRYYIGHTENMNQRLLQHNSGISTFTAKANDWLLKWEKELEAAKKPGHVRLH